MIIEVLIFSLDLVSLIELKFLYFLISFNVFNCHVSSSSSENNHEIDPNIHCHHKKHDDHFDWVSKEEHNPMMKSALLFGKVRFFKLSKASREETYNKSEYTSKDESGGSWWFPTWIRNKRYDEKIHWQLVVQSKTMLIIFLVMGWELVFVKK